LYEAYPPTFTGDFLANQNVWMEDTCSCKKNVRSVRAQTACCHNDGKSSAI